QRRGGPGFPGVGVDGFEGPPRHRVHPVTVDVHLSVLQCASRFFADGGEVLSHGCPFLVAHRTRWPGAVVMGDGGVLTVRWSGTACRCRTGFLMSAPPPRPAPPRSAGRVDEHGGGR